MTLRPGGHGPLDDARQFMQLFPEFRAASWDAWREVLGRLTPDVAEAYLIAGRSSGKSRIASLLVARAASQRYRRVPGEFIYLAVFAPDRKQAAVTFKYVVGLLKSVPALASLIVAERADSVELSNGVIVEVITASTAAPRGRAYALCVVEEAAFLGSDTSANPDVELLRALRPALERVPGSLLVVISSPYARRGVLFQAWERYHEKPDPRVLLLQAPTLDLNPTFDARLVAQAYQDDPISAAAEFGAEFRRDVEGFVSREAVEGCRVAARLELTATPGEVAFVDVAGGSGTDSATLATAKADGAGGVLCLLREVRPPFSPEAMVREFAHTLKARGITRVVGDRYAGMWPREQFEKQGISYEASPLSKSDFYRELLPALNSRRVELLDDQRLIGQLLGLERRTSRLGKDSIDHAPNGHDDLVNSAAGALVLALGVGPAAPGAGFLQYARAAVLGTSPVLGASEDWSDDAHASCRTRRGFAIDQAGRCAICLGAIEVTSIH